MKPNSQNRTTIRHTLIVSTIIEADCTLASAECEHTNWQIMRHRLTEQAVRKTKSKAKFKINKICIKQYKNIATVKHCHIILIVIWNVSGCHSL